MALKGNIRDFPTPQLLNLIHLSRKTGLLTIQGPQVARLWFREGQLIYGIKGDHSGLDDILDYSGQQTSPLLSTQERASGDKEVAHHLIQAGLTSQGEIVKQVEQYICDLVNDTFRWQEGSFTFAPNEFPAQDKITVSLDLEEVILEGKRQLEEWEQLHKAIPDMDVCFRFVERPRQELRQLQFSKDEWRLLSYIDPQNTLRQIGETIQLGELEMRRMIHSLTQAGVIEPVPPAEPEPQTPSKASASREGDHTLLGRFRDRLRRS